MSAFPAKHDRSRPAPPAEAEAAAEISRARLTVVERAGGAAAPLPGALAMGVLDRLPLTLLITGEHGELVWANRSGEILLQDADGLVVDRGGTLRCTLPGPAAALMVLIARAAQGSGGEARIERAPPRSPLVVLASPLPACEAASGVRPRPILTDEAPGALLQIVDPGRPEPAETGPAIERRLRMVYGLTPTEAAVAARLGAGEGMQGAAGALGISVATVRTHAKRAFDKTGIRRQSGLARLVARLAAGG